MAIDSDHNITVFQKNCVRRFFIAADVFVYGFRHLTGEEMEPIAAQIQSEVCWALIADF